MAVRCRAERWTSTRKRTATAPTMKLESAPSQVGPWAHAARISSVARRAYDVAMPTTTDRGAALFVLLCLGLGGCAALPSSDPLNVTVAGIESLPGEGMELRLAVRLRVQNP